MKVYYCPYYIGNYYMDMHHSQVAMDVQVLETQGFLSQLALHAGIHQQMPSFPERLTSYHKALMEYDANHEDNLFHRSIAIDSLSVAKTLLRWRDYLALCGWSRQTILDDCKRLNTLADIDSCYQDEGLAVLLAKLTERIRLMETGKAVVPQTFKSLVIEIPCQSELLPDYVKPLLKSLQSLGVSIQENANDATTVPKTITEIHFSQLWKAEAWLSQLSPTAYDAWINSNNKRLDNWLHTSGKPVCGSVMTETNPQITQMFLLTVQLFQRPLNVNALLQYLFLPECPLNWQLRNKLARTIVSEGGFCNEKVQECINDFINQEFMAENDDKPQEQTREQREENYVNYLPFDLRKEENALLLVEETDTVDLPKLKTFLSNIHDYVSSREITIKALNPFDARVAQLRYVAELSKSLLAQLGTIGEERLAFSKLIQWAQSLYEDGDYTLYQAQVGCRCVINNPANMIGKAQNTTWCDFYGDDAFPLSADFLSTYEQQQLQACGVLLWNRENEAVLMHQMTARPVYMTSKSLTVITCDQQGANKLPMHPLYLQLPRKAETIDGDQLYDEMATKETGNIDNHREEDNREILFDAENHPVSWRRTESYSALEKLLQNPFDYVMKYTLQFTDVNDIAIKQTLTNGNVAHEAIEYLFTAERDNEPLTDFVANHYQQAFHRALVRKGALLLLPENHLEKERLQYQLKNCVNNLAAIIQENRLSVIACEQKEEQGLGLEGGVMLAGSIDMLLSDKAGNEVVFDLKWTSQKDKFKTCLKENRALQLAIYKAMLMNHDNHPQSVRTAYFVMPLGKLFSIDSFVGENCECVNPASQADIMEQLRNGYKERVREISEGSIETAYNVLITDLDYPKADNVFPLISEGKREPKKIENQYSDYKCFTI